MKIYDSVHGFIHFNEIEQELIDSSVFQRLHYIHQLGISYLIYPGGTHTRFEHSLGTMYLAGLIFDQIAREKDRDYYRQIIRLAALCHDLGHLPFSHVAEKALLENEGHEEWTLKMIESKELQPIWDKFPEKNAKEDVAKMALGEEKLTSLRPVTFTPLEKVYSEIITGDFFGADRIDYLLRDAKATGLSYGLFDYAHLIEMLTIVEGEGDTLIIAAYENGIESCEALLLSRYFMQKRVYQYPSIKAYSFHLAQFMKILYGDSKYFQDVESYLSMSEPEVLCELQKAHKDSSHPGHFHACGLFDRKKRFQAIALEEILHFEEFKEKLGLLEGEFHLDLVKKNQIKSKPALPILGKNQKLSPAHEFSTLNIPSSKKNWLFLSQEYQFPV